MANICNSTYVWIGDEQELNALHNLMMTLEKEAMTKYKNPYLWLGLIIEKLGGDVQKIYCRGSWEGLELEDGQLKFYTDTAWNPCNEVMDFIQANFPSLSYYYICEEPGMCIYETNDEFRNYFPERYKVDLCTPNEDYDTKYFYSMESLSKWFKKHYDVEINSIEDVNALHEKWEEENPDAYCYIYEFEIVND